MALPDVLIATKAENTTPRKAAGAWCIESVRAYAVHLVGAAREGDRPPVRRRYQRIWLEIGTRYVRRQTIRTTQRSIDEEDRH